MNGTQPASQETRCYWVPSFENNCKKILLFALGILAIGGAATSILGIVGSLPPLATWVGAADCIASITLIAVLILCGKRPVSIKESARPSPLLEDKKSLSLEDRAPQPYSSCHTETQAPTQSTQPPFVLIQTPQINRAYLGMIGLVERGHTGEAWKLYLNTSYEEKHGCKPQREIRVDSYLGQGDWSYLPPEELLNAVVKYWLLRGENLAEKVCPEFIRDCAVQYPNFRKQCLSEDRLWSCFTGYQEYVADIANRDPSFGLEVMTSLRGSTILSDEYRIEIFRSSYERLLLKINDSSLSENQIKLFSNFLLCYQLVINEEDFQKIEHISHCLEEQRKLHDAESEEYGRCSLFIALLALVEGKLTLQGIYNGKKGFSCFLPVESDLVTGLFNLDWIETVTLKISTATEEESIRKGLIYLSLIPASSPNYINAQFLLGNVWLDLANFSEAGSCFLKVAQLNNEHSPDALMLATMSLLAAVKEETGWDFILREEMEALALAGKEVRTLNPDECRSLNLQQLIEITERLKNAA